MGIRKASDVKMLKESWSRKCQLEQLYADLSRGLLAYGVIAKSFHARNAPGVVAVRYVVPIRGIETTHPAGGSASTTHRHELPPEVPL
jgi:hypothetical protein